jgi:hypothetical protein
MPLTKRVTATMNDGNEKASIELGMKVSVRRSGQNRIGVVTRLRGDYVILRWTNSDLGETAEYEAHRDDVTPLAGWL